MPIVVIIIQAFLLSSSINQTPALAISKTWVPALARVFQDIWQKQHEPPGGSKLLTGIAHINSK
jgi:hypothetical protein